MVNQKFYQTIYLCHLPWCAKTNSGKPQESNNVCVRLNWTEIIEQAIKCIHEQLINLLKCPIKLSLIILFPDILNDLK